MYIFILFDSPVFIISFRLKSRKRFTMKRLVLLQIAKASLQRIIVKMRTRYACLLFLDHWQLTSRVSLRMKCMRLRKSVSLKMRMVSLHIRRTRLKHW